MELLVYARNYRPLGAGAETLAHCDKGAVVGEAAPPFSWGERLCSFCEIRLPVTVVDPGTEIELLIAKAFAVWGHPGPGRVLRFANVRGRISLLLEPGFEQVRDLRRAMHPVLPRARVMLERALRPCDGPAPVASMAATPLGREPVPSPRARAVTSPSAR